MNEHIFFDEDDDDYVTTGFDLKFPSPVVIESYLFSLEYRFPQEYYNFMEDLSLNGMMIADHFLADEIYVLDAMRSGMLRPSLFETSDGSIHVYCQYWSPVLHHYKDFDDLSEIELHWIHSALVERIWSYN